MSINTGKIIKSQNLNQILKKLVNNFNYVKQININEQVKIYLHIYHLLITQARQWHTKSVINDLDNYMNSHAIPGKLILDGLLGKRHFVLYNIKGMPISTKKISLARNFFNNLDVYDFYSYSLFPQRNTYSLELNPAGNEVLSNFIRKSDSLNNYLNLRHHYRNQSSNHELKQQAVLQHHIRMMIERNLIKNNSHITYDCVKSIIYNFPLYLNKAQLKSLNVLITKLQDLQNFYYYLRVKERLKDKNNQSLTTSFINEAKIMISEVGILPYNFSELTPVVVSIPEIMKIAFQTYLDATHNNFSSAVVLEIYFIQKIIRRKLCSSTH